MPLRGNGKVDACLDYFKWHLIAGFHMKIYLAGEL